ncbi:hypothetical protein RhiirC2_857472 [Rhizophagus irregularis]|uniref:Uncharacterized protein n=1 Tax=Rhizophagus irregularis TaxID=588596 RepID=A0A2N1MC21_9GLOM|nr:hypothetical protein RhiirC2_857472 [Rhizophagus irregularis]
MKVTDVIWKNKILNSEKLDDLFMYNFRKEFDWQSTFEFVNNEFTIDEIVQESIYKFEKRLEDDNKNDEIKILRNYNFNLRTPFDNIERKKSNMGDT